MAFKMLFLPPQSERSREMAERLAAAVPAAKVVVAESAADAEREIGDA